MWTWAIINCWTNATHKYVSIQVELYWIFASDCRFNTENRECLNFLIVFKTEIHTRTEADRRFECKYCPMKFFDPKDVKKHEQKHFNTKREQFSTLPKWIHSQLDVEWIDFFFSQNFIVTSAVNRTSGEAICKNISELILVIKYTSVRYAKRDINSFLSCKNTRTSITKTKMRKLSVIN